MNTLEELEAAIQNYINTSEAKRRNRAKIERAHNWLERALTAHRLALSLPSPVSTSTDPAAIECPICKHSHDTTGMVTGCSTYCTCGAWLLVKHRVGSTSLTHVC